MKRTVFFLIILAGMILTSCQNAGDSSRGVVVDLSKIDPGSYDGTWWNRAPVRFVQTNMPETAPLMDVDAYIQSLVDANVTLVAINVGGIVANYPTKLQYHYLNPLLKGDFIGDLVTRLNAEGIRVQCRIDFSKVNETIAAQKPEWLYVSEAGTYVNYNQQVHVCINGGYQQEYIFEILTEMFTNYKFDAIFFNSIGYMSSDYSGNQYGICQCNNCKRKFREMTGYTLPVRTDPTNPASRAYNNFRQVTTREWFEKIRSHLKALNPDVVIDMAADVGVEMTASESAAEIYRETPEWNYSATNYVKRILGSYKDRSPNNKITHFQGLSYRHVGISPHLSRVWLLENMLHGAQLSFYVLGTLVDFEDRSFLSILNNIYGFHKDYEKLFANVQAVNKVAIINGTRGEYQGIMKILTEEHIMYDVIDPAALGTNRLPRKLEDYEALIIPEITNMDERLINIIDTYVYSGGKILTTGLTSTGGAQPNTVKLKALGVNPEYELYSRERSTYLKIYDTDKQAIGWNELKDFDIMMMYTDFMKCEPVGNATGYLRFLPETRYGPPEKIYYTEDEITNYPGVIVNTYGQGKSVFIPWRLGDLYRSKGHYVHRALFASALQNLLNVERTIETNASPLIEMTHLANLNNQFEWIGMINHSGQMGNSFLEPATMHDINIIFKSQRHVKRMFLLNSGKNIPFKQRGDRIEFNVPLLNDFEMALCLYE